MLPGTGGLTRVVDKRHVRRDLADFFSTLVEGRERASARSSGGWSTRSIRPASSRRRCRSARSALAGDVGSAGERPGHHAEPAQPDRHRVVAHLFRGVADRSTARSGPPTSTVQAPTGPQPSTPEEILEAGDQFWPLRAFRELDDALLRLRVNEPEIGTVVIRTEGDRDAVLAIDRDAGRRTSRTGWSARSSYFMKRTLKRLDLTARTFFAFIEPGSAFAGSLFELALAADRSYMFHDDDEENVDRALADERRAAADEQRADAPADALPRRRREGRRAARARRAVQRRATPRKPGSSPSRRTRSTGTTKCGWRSKRARRSRRTR